MLRAFLLVLAVVTALPALAAPAPLTVRAWVAERFGKGDAKKTLTPVFAEASKTLEKQLGVTLVLAEVKPWTPSPAATVNLRAALAEIEESDKAKDVGLAVAFIAPQPAAKDDYHKLMSAEELGRHAAVRAVKDSHEQAAVLVHAIAHALGGVHPVTTGTILSNTWKAAETGFSDDSLALLKLGLDFNQAKSDVDRGAAAARIERELGSRIARFDPKSATDLKEALDRLATTASSDMVLPADEARVFNDAVQAANKRDYAGAFAKVRPLADKPDAPGRVLAFACRLASYDGVTDPGAAARCAKALKLDKSLDAADAAIRYALHKNDTDLAKRAFAEAAARLAHVKAGGVEVDELAAMAGSTGRLTLAEDALARSTAPNVAELKHHIDIDRRRAGVPRGLLSSEDEAAVLADLDRFSKLQDAGAQGDAVDRAIRRYGEVPGLLVERCDSLRKREKYRDAELTCEQAVARYPEASVAHVVVGMAYIDDELAAKAVPHLEKAVALDPDYAQAYVVLDDAYHTVGKEAERGKLRATYQARFGKALVPHHTD